MTEEIKYLSVCGMLGYGFPEEGLWRALEEDLAFIGVDSGSTDPGPYYLGSGNGFVKEMQIRRDLELALLAARRKKIPLIIGSAGGSGAKPHVDAFVKILLDIAHVNKLHFKLAVIYSDIPRETIKQALSENRISPCGPAPELTSEKIDRVCNPVGQFGTEPLIEALKGGADVIISGRCCDTAVFAAYPIWKGFEPGLSLHCAKIAECGALCAYPVGANDSLLCTLRKDHFIVEPVNPARKCTPESVAGHSLYEQPDPECFYEPEGMIDMRQSNFEQVSPRAVKVSGTVLRVPAEHTLKLEGAELKGYRTVTIAGTCDPMVIAHIDELESGVRKAVASNLKGVVAESDYQLIFRRYGLDAGTFVKPENTSLPHEIGLMIEVIAPTQKLADNILSLARSTALHQPFEGRKATAGNLAFPFSPSDLSGGAVYEFSLYHLMKIENPEKMFPVKYLEV
jgi:hypothetical protein